MSRMIKVSDEIGAAVEELAKADGVSMAAEIGKLLATPSPTPVNTTNIEERLDKMAAWLSGQFAELRSLIEDTAVDRLASSGSYGGRRNNNKPKTYLHWREEDGPLGIVQGIYFDFEDSDIWIGTAREEWANSDCMSDCKFWVEDGQIWEDFYGQTKPVININHTLSQYLIEKGVGYA